MSTTKWLERVMSYTPWKQRNNMEKFILGLFADYQLGLITLERVWEIIEEELAIRRVKQLLKV